MRINSILWAILFFLLFADFSTGQETAKADSLIKKLSSVSGIEKVDLLNDIADTYTNSSPAKTIEFAKKSLRLASSIGYKKGIGDSNNLLGIASYYSGQYADALNYYKTSLSIREESGNKKEIASSLNNLGLIYNALGNYQKSLEYGLKSLQIREALGEKYVIGVSLLNVGLVYFNIADYKSALKNYLQALDIMNSLKKDKAALLILNHIGNVNRKLNNTKQALEYYNKALQLSIKIQDRNGQADSYYSMANVNWDLNNYSIALNFYKRSLELYNQSGDKYSIANTCNSLALTYGKLKRLKEMKYFLDKGLALASAINAQPLIEDNYQYTSDYYEAMHDYRNSLKYYKMYFVLNDTLFNKQTNEQIEEIKTRYETEKKEQEITHLQQEKELQKKELEVQRVWRSSLTGGIVFLGILVFIIYNRYTIKKKSELKIKQQNIILETLNNEKDMFLGIAAHDLKNPLASIIIDSATIKMLLNKNRAEEITRKAEEIELTAGRMKDIVSKLLDLNRIESGKLIPEFSNFNMTALINELIYNYNKQALLKGITIHQSTSGEEELFIESDKNLVTQILDNLISNSVKFSGKDSNIFIESCIINNRIIISVKDEGPGFSDNELKELFNKFTKFSAKPTAGEHSTGLGLSIAKTLTGILHGNIRCESIKGSGSTFFVELPFMQTAG